MSRVGILIVGHLDLADNLIATAKFLIGSSFEVKVKGLCVGPAEKAERLDRIVGRAIDEVYEEEGVLVLTDMLGGTPTNISAPYTGKGKVELITGVNLPMVISAITNRNKKTLSELSESVRNAGKESIYRISEWTKGETFSIMDPKAARQDLKEVCGDG